MNFAKFVRTAYSKEDLKATVSRISHYRCSVQKGVLKSFSNFLGKHLYWSLFLIKLQT